MPMKLVVALRDLVFGDEENGAVIRGPNNRIHPLEFFRQPLAGAQVFYLQSVLPVTGRIRGDGQQIIVITRRRLADAEKRVSSREEIHVQDNFLRLLQAGVFAAM